MPASQTQLKARCERLKPDDEPTAYTTDTAMITTTTKDESESACSGMATYTSYTSCYRQTNGVVNFPF